MLSMESYARYFSSVTLRYVIFLLGIFAVMLSNTPKFLILLAYFFDFFLIMMLPGFLMSFLFTRLRLMERLVLAFPLSSVTLFFLNMVSLTGLRLTKDSITLFFIVLYFALFVLFGRRLKTALRKFLLSPNHSDLMGLLAVIVLVFLVWGYALNETYIPYTQGIGYYSRVEFVLTSLYETGVFPLWNMFSEFGYPMLTFDPPFFFESTAVYSMLLQAKSLVLSFNTFYFYSIMLLGLSLYALMRVNFSVGPFFAVIAVLLFISSSHLVYEGSFNGYVKMIVPLSIYIACYMIFLKSLQNHRFYYLLSVLLSILFLYYPSLVLAFIVFSVLYILFIRLKKPETGGHLSCPEVRHIVLPIMLFIAMISFWLVPNVSNLDYIHSSQPPSLLDFGVFNKRHLSVLIEGPDLEYRILDNKIFFLYLICFLSLVISKRRQFDTFNIYLLSIISFFVISVFLESMSVVNNMEFYRVVNIIISLFSAILFSKSLSHLKNKGFYMLFATLFVISIVLAAFQAYSSRYFVKMSFIEGVQSGEGLSNEITFLKSQEFGRIKAYGVYTIVFDNFVTQHSMKPGVGGGFSQAQYALIEEKFYKTDRGYDYLSNILKKTFIRYILVNNCDPKVDTDILSIKQLDISRIYERECVKIYKMPGSFIEKTHVYQWSMDVDELYSMPGAYRVDGVAGMPAGEFVNQQTDLSQLPEPEPLAFSIENIGADEINITGSFKKGDWVLVKQHYFPRWKALMNERELTVRPTKLGMILIQVDENGERIILVNKPFGYEAYLSIVSILAILLFFISLYRKGHGSQ